MPYESNTYISEKGREYSEHIFDSLFPSDPTTGEMIVNTVSDVVDHFRGPGGDNLHNTCQIMKNFIQGYEQFGWIESFNSGIHVCPHCQRRDFIWYWEYIDFGLRLDNDEWTSSLKLQKQEYDVGGGMTDIGYRFNCRVRCNEATTCNQCHETVTGKFSNCKSCGSSDVSNVGCSKESYTQHLVKDNKWQTWVESDRGRTQQRSISVWNEGTGQIAPTYNMRPFMFRVAYNGPAPKGKIITEPSDAYMYMPSLEIGYETYDGENQRPYGYKCPNSDCNFVRYAPPNGEKYDVEISGSYQQQKMQLSGTSDKPSGIYPTINNGREENCGLVGNMGSCPMPSCSGTALVPNISIKEKLPSICFQSGNPKMARTVTSSWRVGTKEPDDEGIQIITQYVNRQVARYRNATPVSYPFTPALRAFARSRSEICLKCYGSSYYGGESAQYFWKHGMLQNECVFCGEWKPSERALHPKMRMNPPMRMKIVNPQPLTLGDVGGSMRSGELDESGGSIWSIRMDCPQAPEFALMQMQLQMWTLMPIPDSPIGPPMTGQGIQMCPNDVEGIAFGEVAKGKLEEKMREVEVKEDSRELLTTKLVNLDGDAPDGSGTMKNYWKRLQTESEVPLKIVVGSRVEVINVDRDAEFQTITTGDLLKYRPGDLEDNPIGRQWEAKVRTENVLLPPGEDSVLGITGPGFTFVVCEGRSREGYRDKRSNTWVDVSPECISYHNREDPANPLKDPIYYPRWTQTPANDLRPPARGTSEGTTVANDGDYYWNHTTHFSQDQYVINDYLSQFMGGSASEPTLEKRFHDFGYACDPIIQVDKGVYYNVYECATCKKKYDIGRELQADGTYTEGAASIAYWSSKGLVDSEGKTMDEDLFPQECIDAAIEQEKDNPANFGVEDSMMTSMGRGGGRSAKEMLENPRLVVELDE
jgi:hypothetical protein